MSSRKEFSILPVTEPVARLTFVEVYTVPKSLGLFVAHFPLKYMSIAFILPTAEVAFELDRGSTLGWSARSMYVGWLSLCLQRPLLFPLFSFLYGWPPSLIN